MAKTAIFMADGCEEIEGLTVVDLLRRAEIEIDMVSINGKKTADGAHGISFSTDTDISEIDWDSYDALICPGGLPGTNYLAENEILVGKLREFKENGKLIAAICAAPALIFGENGLVDGSEATCYPGLEDKLKGAKALTEEVVVSKNVITSRGMGTAIPFALAIVSYIKDEDTAKKLGESIVFRI